MQYIRSENVKTIIVFYHSSMYTIIKMVKMNWCNGTTLDTTVYIECFERVVVFWDSHRYIVLSLTVVIPLRYWSGDERGSALGSYTGGCQSNMTLGLCNRTPT